MNVKLVKTCCYSNSNKHVKANYHLQCTDKSIETLISLQTVVDNVGELSLSMGELSCLALHGMNCQRVNHPCAPTYGRRGKT